MTQTLIGQISKRKILKSSKTRCAKDLLIFFKVKGYSKFASTLFVGIHKAISEKEKKMWTSAIRNV